MLSDAEFMGDLETAISAALVNGRHDRLAGDTETAATGSELRDRFIAGGLVALQRDDSAGAWVQVGVACAGEQRSMLYGELQDTARRLHELGHLRNFFFMHKPPGIRARFEAAGGHKRDVESVVTERTAAWLAEDVVTQVVPGVYEPESLLFGGSRSMAHVHRLFSLDSDIWLSRLRGGQEDAMPAWALSLALLRPLLDGLGVLGWEDLDVWDRVGWQTGRRLPGSVDATKARAAMDGIRTAWNDRSTASDPALATHLDGIRTAAKEWADGYFLRDGALIGPREAAAFYVIFHWNRGGLSLLTQSLIATALADRTARP